MSIRIPTEPIGSVPRPLELVNGMKAFAAGQLDQHTMNELYDKAVRDTIERFAAAGSDVITDGEQTKPSFISYPLAGSTQLDPKGAVIPFADGHTRQLPLITGGPFRYQHKAAEYLRNARRFTQVPMKQAVISASAMSLVYPQNGIPDYSRETFMADLMDEHESDIRGCLAAGAYNVQVDFTEGRLALKLDPSKGVLKAWVDLNNQVLGRFNDQEREKLGVHTCPGGDHDSTHSADIPYAELLPSLFELNVTNFYMQFASEKDKREVLKSVKALLKPGQRVFLGVTDVINARIETADEIRETIMEAADFIPLDQLGTTDDCGFSPFADDTGTSRDIAFSKMKARIEGTKLAEAALSRTRVVM